VSAAVKNLIQPEGFVGNYHLIVGEPETGKTTLAQLAIEDLPEPKGVFYVYVPNNPEIEISVRHEWTRVWRLHTLESTRVHSCRTLIIDKHLKKEKKKKPKQHIQ
jgi:KaiC/GvpD/RAD55 family RecA-like ATPase